MWTAEPHCGIHGFVYVKADPTDDVPNARKPGQPRMLAERSPYGKLISDMQRPYVGSAAHAEVQYVAFAGVDNHITPVQRTNQEIRFFGATKVWGTGPHER